jgi:B12-binding domain/radical SAM domain protein
LKPDIVFIHSPSIFDFRKRPIMFGPVSDVVPSTPVFEMYPIGFAILSAYLEKRGFRTRIVNLAVHMLNDPTFDVEAYLRQLDARVFGFDLHWLPHAQGALEVAAIVKRLHPDTPILFGGLSSTYYAAELIQYPQVDMVMKGDSTEEPLAQLLAAVRLNGSLHDIPNLTWKDRDGTIYCQPITYVPERWTHSRIDYGFMIKSVLKNRDLRGNLPFRDFMRYPIVAAFACRGGVKDCSICGGSRFTYRTFFGRPRAAFREPETLAFDIADAASYFTGPIFVIGDVQAGGDDYADRFLQALAKYRIRNMVCLEFWTPPPRELFQKISKALPNWSFEISCESQDDMVRRKFGKAIYTNEGFRQAIADGLAAGAQRADVYFLTGIPYQTRESILGIPDFVEYLYSGLNGNRSKLVCFAAPLAPFVDPGSLAFEKPELYGYRIVRRTLEDHRQAIVEPSWKYWLNYESEYLSRDDLADATYECAYRLNAVKYRAGAIGEAEYNRVARNIQKARELMERIDDVYHSSLSPVEKEARYFDLKEDMRRYSMSTVCEKRELEWNVSQLRKFRLRGILKALIS